MHPLTDPEVDMRVPGIFGTDNLFNAVRVQSSGQFYDQRAVQRVDGEAVRDALSSIAKLRGHLSEFEDALAVRGTSSGPAYAVSRTPLSLSMTETATTRMSTEEVNATPTSFSPFGPDFDGSSSSLPTIGGVYTGTTSEVLTFQARSTEVVGARDKVRFDVFDSAGNRLERVSFERYDPAGTVVQLDNGLTLSLSDGFVQRKDTFEVEVFASVGSVVRPDQPFNAVRNDQANLEYGQSVQAGSFEVNGVSVNVAADDSLNSVLAKIEAADPQVIARFDAQTETVQLTQRTMGEDGRIELTDDTSGFLAATKLSASAEVIGTSRDQIRRLADVDDFSAVQYGELDINGHRITVDPTIDSLDDILDRISAIGPGITATLSSDGTKVSIASSHGIMELSDHGSGLLDALGIQAGRYGQAQSGSEGPDVAKYLAKFSRSFNRLFERGASAGPELAALQDTLRKTLADRLGVAGESRRKDFGLVVDLTGERTDILRFRGGAANALKRELAQRPDRLRQVFVTRTSTHERTLIEQLQEQIAGAEAGLQARLGTRGTVVDFRA